MCERGLISPILLIYNYPSNNGDLDMPPIYTAKDICRDRTIPVPSLACGAENLSIDCLDLAERRQPFCEASAFASRAGRSAVAVAGSAVAGLTKPTRRKSTTLNGDIHTMMLLPPFSELDRLAVLYGELRFIEHSQHGVSRSMRRRRPPAIVLDLHGLSAREAHKAIEACLRTCLIEGRRCVDIIHGKGLHSPGGFGILRILSRHWLSRSDVVEAFCSPNHNEGKVRVRLTCRRRSRA